VRPSPSVRASAQSSDLTPPKTAEASIGGAKRAPSSFVQLTSSTARRVRTPPSFKVRITSSPERTPRMPSKRPPAICVSR